MLVPGATLAGLVAVTLLAAVRAASGLLRGWSLALAVFFGVTGCVLGAIAVAHVAARIAAHRSGTGR